ncbi:MAG TPA: D-aminoacyl-tRNA deacylase [Acidobacteriota bacterium]|nr:D-aminoacyl-tRNA deacylase [Acidobacteriota bacterium]
MKAVVQRVSQAEVIIDNITVSRIGHGLLAFVAFSHHDTDGDFSWMAGKISELRIFSDSRGKMNLGLPDIRGELMIVSQFTLYGDCRKGRRPSYSEAAFPAEAEAMYHKFLAVVRTIVPDVQTGQFQAEMEVRLTNAGPVTLVIDSRDSREQSRGRK